MGIATASMASSGTKVAWQAEPTSAAAAFQLRDQIKEAAENLDSHYCSGERLKEAVLCFFNDHAAEIIGEASPKGTTDAEVGETIGRLEELPLLVRTELLLAIEETHELKALTAAGFMRSLERIADEIGEDKASTLIYAIRSTGNVDDLTDGRMFGAGALRCYGELDSETFSGLVFAVGNTGEMAIADPAVLREMTAASRSGGGLDAKLFGELAHAVGVTGNAEELTGGGFLEGLSALPMKKRIELASAIWVTGKVRELTDASVIERIGNGADVWNDIVTGLRDGADSRQTVLFARL